MDVGAYKAPSVRKDTPLGLPVKCRRLIKKRSAAFRTWVELKTSKDERWTMKKKKKSFCLKPRGET